MGEISSKPQQRYIISQNPESQQPGVQPLSLTQLEDALNTIPGINVIHKVEPVGIAVLSGGVKKQSGLVVASMSQTTAQTLNLQAPHLRISPDRQLTLGEPDPGSPSYILNPLYMLQSGSSVTYRISVLDEQGQGIGGVKVVIIGGPAEKMGVTASDGTVTLVWETYSRPEPAAIYVIPNYGYWERWVPDPLLDPSGVTSVTLTPLTDTFPTLASEDIYGWGQRAMSLDKLSPSFRGAGIKVAVIDSGSDTVHPDLSQIQAGLDLTVVPPSGTWTTDTMAHGSHCAGVITGSTGTNGIRGFAPDAEVHTLKVLPGGYFINLIEAVKYCINNGIDVINMSLGGEDESPDLLEIIALARQNGIATIVAAGNTGSNVLFPATSPDVLTVGAMGKFGTYPDDTYHALQVGIPARNSNGAQEYFSAKFSCHGPRVDVCAPGVAVLSSVPGNGYAAWDGTSMAAPHVTGMAALLLAHHPDFKERFRARNVERVNHLFGKIVRSSIPIDVGDSELTGWGMPNVEKAFSDA
jgi:hypothetical protein